MSQAEDSIRTFEYEGVTYRFAMPSAEKQRAVQYRLTKYGLEPMLRGLALAEVGAGSAISVMLGVLAGMFSRIPEDDYNYICDTMTAKLFIAGSDKQMNINDFSGRIRTYLNVVALTIGSTFEDFTGLLTLLQKSTASSEAVDQSQESA